MKLTLLRFSSGPDDSLGLLYMGPQFQCFTLEDEMRLEKVPQETRIPAGVYTLELRKAGTLHQKYKARYPWHEGMVWVRNVPGFQWIYFHVGNHESDTAGCILVGNTVESNADGYGGLGQSVVAYEAFYKKLLPSLKGTGATLTIKDEISIETLLAA